MTDELELLKKDWQRKGENLPRLSYDQIYRMIWKKSSSIVKWIFYISILEFIFWTIINIIATDAEYFEEVKQIHMYEIDIVLNVISYLILIYFIYKFYMNYRKISVTDSSRQLMKTILDVKRTVTQYVWFNISLFTVTFIITFYASLKYLPEGKKIIENATQAGNGTLFWLFIIGVSVVFIAILLVLVWLFYKLLYGILLKRLRQNYRELKQLEV
jgi:hypothetical protein